MPIDTSMYGTGPSVQLQGPMDQYAKMMTLRHLIDSSEMSALQRQQVQQALDDDNTLRRIMGGYGNAEDAVPELYRAGLYKPAMAITKQGLDIRKARSDINKADADTEKTRLESELHKINAHRQLLANINSQEDLDALRAQIAAKDPTAAAMIPKVYDPREIRIKLMDANARISALTPKYKMINNGKWQLPFDENPDTNPNPMPIAMETTPGEDQNAQIERSRLAETSRHNLVTEALQGREEYSLHADPVLGGLTRLGKYGGSTTPVAGNAPVMDILPRIATEGEKNAYQASSEALAQGRRLFDAVKQNPEAFGLVQGVRSTIQNKTGAPVSGLTPQQEAVRAGVYRQAYEMINKLAGAALSPAEAGRIMQFAPNPNDGVDVLMAKMRSAMEYAQTTRSNLRTRYPRDVAYPSDPALPELTGPKGKGPRVSDEENAARYYDTPGGM